MYGTTITTTISPIAPARLGDTRGPRYTAGDRGAGDRGLRFSFQRFLKICAFVRRRRPPV